SFAGVEAEEHLMHEGDHFAHGDDGQARDRADHHREDDYARLARADDGAEAVGDFELAAERAHGQRFNQAGMTNGLNGMTLAGASDGFQRIRHSRRSSSRAPFLHALTTGESARKCDEKSGDFHTPYPLKNVAKSTY